MNQGSMEVFLHRLSTKQAKLVPVRMQLVTELKAYLAEYDMRCLLSSYSL